MWALLVIFGTSCALSLVANRVARELARRVGLVDRPDGHRKLQSQAIPLAGGIAIFVAMLATIAGLAVFDDGWRSILFRHGSEAAGLLAAGSLIIALGIIDDSVGLRGRQKLVGQVVAAAILVVSGICVERVQVLGWQVELGALAIPFTIFWLVGAINALNLLDGMDGLAGTLGLILSAAIAIMAVLNGHATIALVATVLAGSLVGFLRFNLPPATMYLGDAGSMLIGLLVGVMAIQASLKGPGTVLMAVPLALWTIPIFDSGAAIIRRKLTGRSIYTTDRAHLHHHLVQRMGNGLTLVCVGSVALMISVAALASVWLKIDLIAIVCSFFVVLMFITLRVFGHSELLLATVRMRGLARSIFLSRPQSTGVGWNDTVHLQGTREWGRLWDMLTECAEKLEFVQMRLDVNVPILGEGYHASWSRPANNEPNRLWRLELPLIADKRVLGYVKVVGERDGIGGHNLEQLVDLLDEFELHLLRVLRSEAPSQFAVARNGSHPESFVKELRAQAVIPDSGFGETLTAAGTK
jgi:UDP-GlcNAc:undecaprenyl-phosphate GlcNAc-1-phosphate transferase